MKRSSREALALLLGSTAFGLAFSYPILGRLSQVGTFDDWDYSWQLHWAPVYIISHFHQLPLWNPYKCGGMALLGNPQARILTPFFPLHLLLGPIIGLHLEIPLHLAVAVSGAYCLARVLGLGTVAAMACGAVFAGSSWFFLHSTAGHAVFLPAVYLPWIVACYWQGLKTGRFIFESAGAALLALTFFEGGVYSLTYAGILLSTLATVTALQRRDIKPLALLLILGVFAAGYATIKLLPSYYLSQRFPRDVSYLTEHHSLGEIFGALFSRVQDPSRRPFVPGVEYAFWEIGAYIGPFVIPLLLLGLTRPLRALLPWLVAGVLLIALAMGNFAPYAPWSLLQHLPVFAWERVVSRFIIPFTLVAAVIAAFGVEFICAHGGRVLALLYLLIITTDLFLVGPPILAHIYDGGEPSIAPLAQFRQVGAPEGRFIMYALSVANEGAASCYEYAEPGTQVRGFDQPGYRGEYYLLGAGTIALGRWTPNALSYDVSTPSANVVVINQNYDAYWRLARGRGEVLSHNGLLAVRVPAGNQHLRLVYRSTAFELGAAISLLTCALTLGLWAGKRRHRLASHSG
jgi:hypothetical protein